MADKMTKEEVLAAMDDAPEYMGGMILSTDDVHGAAARLEKARAAVCAMYDKMDAIEQANKTVDAEEFDDDFIMDIADGVEGEFEGESTEPFYSFTPGQLRAFFNRMVLARAKGGA